MAARSLRVCVFALCNALCFWFIWSRVTITVTKDCFSGTYLDVSCSQTGLKKQRTYHLIL